MMTCSHCKEEKSLDDFHRAKGRPNDRHPQCKICRSELGREAALAKNDKRRERLELLANGKQRCVSCCEVLHLDDFYKSSRNKSGRKGQCITCYKTVGLEYRSRPESRELYRRRRQERRESDPERHQRQQRNSTLRSKYGIDLNEYNEMLARQCGLCAICGELPDEGALLFVDHCHESGAVRQLLCHQCNAGLGFFRDREDLLVAAIRYLSANSHQSKGV